MTGCYGYRSESDRLDDLCHACARLNVTPVTVMPSIRRDPTHVVVCSHWVSIGRESQNASPIPGDRDKHSEASA